MKVPIKARTRRELFSCEGVGLDHEGHSTLPLKVLSLLESLQLPLLLQDLVPHRLLTVLGYIHPVGSPDGE